MRQPLDTRTYEIYQQHIKPLSRDKRLHLLAMIAQELAQESAHGEPERNIMELHGLGKEIWEGIDAQEYVHALRQEWEHRI